MGAHRTPPSRDGEERDVHRAIDATRAIVRALRLNTRAVEQAIGISGAQLFVLQQLADGPVQSMNELAERTLTHQSSVSVVVGRLVDAGYVSRTPSAEDARRVTLALTARGRALLRRAPATVQRQLMDGLRQLPPAQLHALASGLEAWLVASGIATLAPPLFFEDDSARRPRRSAGRRPRTSR